MAAADADKSATLTNEEQREAAKWEYEVLSVATAAEMKQHLNRYAAQGWEPVSYGVSVMPEGATAGPYSVVGGGTYIAFLRRNTEDYKPAAYLDPLRRSGDDRG